MTHLELELLNRAKAEVSNSLKYSELYPAFCVFIDAGWTPTEAAKWLVEQPGVTEKNVKRVASALASRKKKEAAA